MPRRLVLMLLALLLAAFAGRPGSGYAQTSEPTNTPSSVIAPIITATPRPDGSLVHVVGFGQSLTEIAKAYGVTVSEIQRFNGLPPDASTLYSGQKLLIIPRGGPNQLLAPTATQPPPPTLEPTAAPIAEIPAPTLVAPAASPNSGMILPLAGGLILLGGFLLLAAALVIQRRK